MHSTVICIVVVSASAARTDANKSLRYDYVLASFLAFPHDQSANMPVQSNNKFLKTSLSVKVLSKLNLNLHVLRQNRYRLPPLSRLSVDVVFDYVSAYVLTRSDCEHVGNLS